MTAVAVESVVKLLAFLLVGVYVTWGLFGGFGDLFGRIAAHPDWSRLLVLDGPQTASYARWTAMLVISMAAVMFLPRQFHVLVVQNPRERDVNSVSWSFPLYLFLINLFVLPIAFAGLLVFPEAGAEADGFILRLPLHFDSHLISVVVFLGGFSAATAMIVVDSLALSKMITNDVILPVLLRRRYTEDIYWITLFYTRLACSACSRLDCCGRAWRAASYCSSRWGSCPSSPSRSARRPSCSGSTGAGAAARGRRRGSRRVLHLVLHADPARPGPRGDAPALALDRGAARDRLPSADGIPRLCRASTPSATGSSGRSS